ncbi:DUF6879 family protein [Streptomyces sp. NPDC047071]|uniref:DUF6879 family protein n=1 Tax=Streptomyces sp. NPDC047071 TaxID=3154808 RepID=UPI0034517260
MTRRLRFNGTGSGNGGCPSVHEDLDSGEIIVHGPPLTGPDDVAQLQHLNEGEVAVVVPRTLLVDFGPKEVARVPDIIGLDEFGALFSTFKHTAWRLETRQRFASDEEDETYQQFARGETIQWDLNDEWSANIRKQTGEGKRVERVRVIDNPPTPGQRYLLDNAVRRNILVGEDIRNLWREEADTLKLPSNDFWIFDSRLIALLNFDDDDQLVNVELITEPAVVLRYAQVRDAAWHHAVPAPQFAENLPETQ